MLRSHDFTDRLLEVTGLFRNPEKGKPPRQAIERQREYIVNLAANIWKQRNYQNIEVSIDFRFGEEYPKLEAQHLANQIIEIVSKNIPATYSHVFVSDTGYEVILPEDIVCIFISNLPTYKKSYWTISDGSFIPKIDLALIQSAITKKQNTDYKVSKNSETWLLVVADGSRFSSNFDFPQDVLTETYISSFDKVYLFATLLNKAHLLTLEK